jgi:hypothetical protein
MRILNDGYIKLSHGDYDALGRSNGVTGGVRGQTSDYSSTWMDEVEPGRKRNIMNVLPNGRSGYAPAAWTLVWPTRAMRPAVVRSRLRGEGHW